MLIRPTKVSYITKFKDIACCRLVTTLPKQNIWFCYEKHNISSKLATFTVYVMSVTNFVMSVPFLLDLILRMAKFLKHLLHVNISWSFLIEFVWWYSLQIFIVCTFFNLWENLKKLGFFTIYDENYVCYQLEMKWNKIFVFCLLHA